MHIGAIGCAKLTNEFHRPNWDAQIMIAIAGAESSWDTTATSATNDFGLWQINNQAWPELFAHYNWWDPHDNAAMMNHVWIKQGYNAWTTYWQGQYRAYMDAAAQALGATGGATYGGGGGTPPSGPSGGTPSDVAGAIAQITQAVTALADLEMSWSRRIDTMW